MGTYREATLHARQGRTVKCRVVVTPAIDAVMGVDDEGEPVEVHEAEPAIEETRVVRLLTKDEAADVFSERGESNVPYEAHTLGLFDVTDESNLVEFRPTADDMAADWELVKNETELAAEAKAAIDAEAVIKALSESAATDESVPETLGENQ